MTSPTGNWKLTVGKLWDAWRDYPRQRCEIANVPPGRTLFVTGTHRSGTTWVAKMLAVPGLWYVHEPFNRNKNVWKESFSYAGASTARPDVDRLMRRVLNGTLRHTLNLRHADHPLMPLRLFRQPVRRILIKDPLACLLTGYLHEQFDLQTLVLFRHPCGFVASIIRLGWPTASIVRTLIERDALVSDHLAPYLPVLHEHTQQDGIAAAAALGCALNTVLWRTCEIHQLHRARFEDLCRNPIGQFRELFEWADLPYSAAVRQAHERLCFAAEFDPRAYRPHAVQRNSRAMADSWKGQLAPNKVALVREIWEQFDVPLYRANKDWETEPTIRPQEIST